MKSYLFKQALRRRFGIKKGWVSFGIPITGLDSSEEEE